MNIDFQKSGCLRVSYVHNVYYVLLICNVYYTVLLWYYHTWWNKDYQTNNYMLAFGYGSGHAFGELGKCELNYGTGHLLFWSLSEVVNLLWRTEDETSVNDFLMCPFKKRKSALSTSCLPCRWRACLERSSCRRHFSTFPTHFPKTFKTAPLPTLLSWRCPLNSFRGPCGSRLLLRPR